MRLSKEDPADASKRRHFEISIDSPFHILSCQATHANTTLPEYGRAPVRAPTALGSCVCAQRHRGAPPALLARPMHLIRHPSTNPPPFDADEAPPALATPPPRYEAVVGGGAGLAGYFARLAAAEGESEDSGSEDGVARTPGRAARSLDERRAWRA